MYVMKYFLILIFLCISWISLNAQCVADVEDKHRCSVDSTVQLGGTPTALNGTPPYTYEWWIEPIPTSSQAMPYIYASDILDDTTLANPTLIYTSDSYIGDSINFYLKITDDIGCQSEDTMLLTTTHFGIHLIYHDYYIEPNDSVYLNQIPNICCGFGSTSYSWSPSHGLSDTTLPSGFWAKPDSSISYTLTVADSKGCQQTAGGPLYYVHVGNVGVENTENISSGVKLYPNPSSDIVNIEVDENVLIEKIKVFDLNGKEIDLHIDNTKKINLQKTPRGTYIVEIHTQKGEIIRRKIVKE